MLCGEGRFRGTAEPLHGTGAQPEHAPEQLYQMSGQSAASSAPLQGSRKWARAEQPLGLDQSLHDPAHASGPDYPLGLEAAKRPCQEAPAQDGASSKLRGSTLMSLQQQGGPDSTATPAATRPVDISGQLPPAIPGLSQSAAVCLAQDGASAERLGSKLAQQQGGLSAIAASEAPGLGDRHGHPPPSMPGLAQSAAGSPVSIPGLDAEVPLSQARESRSLPSQEMQSNSPPDAMQLPSAATEDAAAQGETGIAPASVSGTGTHTSTEDNSTAAARDGEDGARQGGMTGPAAAPGMPGGADLTIDSAHSFWRERAQQHLTMQRQRAADLKRQQQAHQHALEQSKALSSAQARGDLTQEQQQLQTQQLTQHVPEGAYAEGPDNSSAVPEQHKDVQQPRQSSLGAHPLRSSLSRLVGTLPQGQLSPCSQ